MTPLTQTLTLTDLHDWRKTFLLKWKLDWWNLFFA